MEDAGSLYAHSTCLKTPEEEAPTKLPSTLEARRMSKASADGSTIMKHGANAQAVLCGEILQDMFRRCANRPRRQQQLSHCKDPHEGLIVAKVRRCPEVPSHK